MSRIETVNPSEATGEIKEMLDAITTRAWNGSKHYAHVCKLSQGTRGFSRLV